MKRRLRKKRRLGEFREYGFSVLAQFPSGARGPEAEARLDEFIRFVETRNLGVGGNPEGTGGFVSRLCTNRRCRQCNRRYGRDRVFTPVTDADRDDVVAWFRSRGGVASAGPLIDAHHCTEAEFDASLPTLPEV